MKRILAICLMMLTALSLSVTAFADPGEFVSSPSGYPTPTIITFTPSNEECTAELVITPYGDRYELSDALRTMFESAYAQISGTDDITTLNDDFAKVVADKKIDPANLAVSDFFDIHVTGCDYHEGHVDFDVVLDADSLSHFVGLLHMEREGHWEFVDNAKVVNNGEHLQFSVEAFSPFAIVIDTESETIGTDTDVTTDVTTDVEPGTTTQGPANAPQTGMTHSSVHAYSVVMIACIAAATVTVVKYRKRTAR